VRNFARNSKFDIRIDFEKSHDSFLYDKNTNKKYLDFFGMYASLPLGYNHEIFQTDEYKEEMLRLSRFKINNCEFVSDETLEFDRLFTEYAGKETYKHFHYSCTGALAVEAAIKTCMEYKKHTEPKIISFHNSFHGINSYGGFVTSRFYPAIAKLEGIPQPYSVKLKMDLDDVFEELMKGKVTCIITEPIQCSAGDLHHNRTFFVGLRELGKLFNVPIIHDEIQIGFGSTGHLWHYEYINVEPDIVVFGKKTQLSGIMVKEQFGDIFDKHKCTKLEVTWDADILDMVRCKYIIQAYKKYGILDNVIEQSDRLLSGLSEMEEIQNLRNCGLIVGFDLTNQKERDILVTKLYNNGLICNRTGEKSVRLRPNLNVSADEVDKALEIFRR
tara:strand:- start:72 stop:1229 length:1158 start_codon:yes stop_codon:yes gene_type:complete